MMNRLKGWIEKVRQRRVERKDRRFWYADEWQYLSISVGAQGIAVSNNSRRSIAGTPISIGWKDFDRIVVYKRDRMTVDDICMAFECGGRMVLELSEEMGGWTALVRSLSDYLDSVVEYDAWYAWVFQPPFEPSAMTIYDAKAQAERLY